MRSDNNKRETPSSQLRIALERVHHFYRIRGQQKRKVAPIPPSKLCASFKWFVDQNFLGDFRWRDGRSTEELGAVCARLTAYLQEQIANEQEMLSFNWLKVGQVLDGLIEKLFGSLGITALTEDYREFSGCETAPTFDEFLDRNIVNKFLAEIVFRELDFQDKSEIYVNSKNDLMSVCLTKIATRESMTFFLSQVVQDDRIVGSFPFSACFNEVPLRARRGSPLTADSSV
jgi:hypothetical protein